MKLRTRIAYFFMYAKQNLKLFVQKHRREYKVFPTAISSDYERRWLYYKIIFPHFFTDFHKEIAYVKVTPAVHLLEDYSLKLTKQFYRKTLWKYIRDEFLFNEEIDSFRDCGIFPTKKDLQDEVYADFCATDIMYSYLYYLKFVTKDLKGIKLFFDERSVLAWDEEFRPLNIKRF